MAISKLSVTLSLSALCLALVSCASSGDKQDPGYGGAGGMSTTGIVGGSGSAVGAGGSVATGGSVVAGGAVSVGGSVATGGTVGSGGVTPIGGQPTGAGGIVGAGGSGSGARGGTGGSSTGGSGTGGRVGASGSSGAGSPGGTGGIASAGKGGTSSSTGGASAGAAGRVEIRTRKITARGFTFDALETVSTGEPVLLLHGFPDTSLEWTNLMPVLAAAGYHCLAPDQRGYSPGARPTEVDAYKYEELVADAFAIGSELGERFHVVGHDWGTNVGWLMLQNDPSRIASFTAISIPHYRVWAQSVYDDPKMASYLTMLKDWMNDGESIWTAAQMKSMWKAKPADQRDATIAHMTEPGAMTAALNWYRASRGHQRAFEDFDVWEVSVPTLLIHGSTDMGELSVTDTKPLMKGPYRVVRPTGGHFIVDEQPKVVADEILAQLRAYPLN